jgi:hypothetical protein
MPVPPVLAVADDIREPPVHEKASKKEEWIYPHPTSFKLGEHPIDEVRPLRVAVIGAGLSGVTAGVLFPAKVPGIDLTILEKNSDVGGTW